jgi:hypothetical protein
MRMVQVNQSPFWRNSVYLRWQCLVITVITLTRAITPIYTPAITVKISYSRAICHHRKMPSIPFPRLLDARLRGKVANCHLSRQSIDCKNYALGGVSLGVFARVTIICHHNFQLCILPPRNQNL